VPRERTVRDVFAHDEGIWDITRMRSYVLRHPGRVPARTILFADPSTRALVEYVRANYAWDPERVAGLTERELRDPLFSVVLPSGASLFVDGVHRLLRLERDGAPGFRVRIFPAAIADRFRVSVEIKPAP
jgi:hypothetical protein